MTKSNTNIKNKTGKMPTTESNEKGIVNGFSKLNRKERIAVLQSWLGIEVSAELDLFLIDHPEIQKTIGEFSENYLSNYVLPFGIVPNLMVNNELFMVPVVIEESSVVAAASRAAGFWAKNGGFKTKILGATKKGQVHFIWDGHSDELHHHFHLLKPVMFSGTHEITRGMRNRGGGITKIELIDMTHKLKNYYQIDVSFDTADAMGANFINTCLEKIATILTEYFDENSAKGKIEIIMSILSNYTPECIVNCSVECNVQDLTAMSGNYSPHEFARRFKLAVDMANSDVSRAVTHNKGIYNGADGVILATGNDWRATEAAGHAFAARNGHYQSLSEVGIEDHIFRYSITLPLALGTVGGLTRSHPLTALALKILKNPSASRLMEITAALGMASNFSAVASLVTSGIQKGHMKMHLNNMLNQLGATDDQKEKAIDYFSRKPISYASVEQFLKNHSSVISNSNDEL